MQDADDLPEQPEQSMPPSLQSTPNVLPDQSVKVPSLVRHSSEPGPVAARSYNPATAKQEMNEVLSIVAHTWSRAQSATISKNQALTEELHLAHDHIAALTHDLQAAEAQTQVQLATIDMHKARDEAWCRKASKMASAMTDMHSELASLREAANTQRKELAAQRAVLASVESTVSDVAVEAIKRARKGLKLSAGMSEVMQEMREQLGASQLSADYLLAQLEEKTGMLVEARDEVRLSRVQQSKSSPVVPEALQIVQAELQKVLRSIDELALRPDSTTQIQESLSLVISSVGGLQEAREEVKSKLVELSLGLESKVDDHIRQSNEASSNVESKLHDLLAALVACSTEHKAVAELQQQLIDQQGEMAKLTEECNGLAQSLAQSEHEVQRAQDQFRQRALAILHDSSVLEEDYDAVVSKVFDDLKAARASSSTLQHNLDAEQAIQKSLQDKFSLLETTSAIVQQTAQQKDEQLRAVHDQLRRMQEKLGLDVDEYELLEINSIEHHILRTELRLECLVNERDELRMELLALTDEQTLHMHSTPMLEEQLAAVQGKLVVAQDETAACIDNLTAAQQRHDVELSDLQLRISFAQRRGEVAERERDHAVDKLMKFKEEVAKMWKTETDSHAKTLTALRSSIHGHKTDAKLARELLEDVADKIEDYDDMSAFCDEQGAENEELSIQVDKLEDKTKKLSILLEYAKDRLREESLQAASVAVMQSELASAEDTIVDLEERLQSIKTSALLEPVRVQSPPIQARIRDADTPDVALDELFSFFSNGDTSTEPAHREDLTDATPLAKVPHTANTATKRKRVTYTGKDTSKRSDTAVQQAESVSALSKLRASMTVRTAEQSVDSSKSGEPTRDFDQMFMSDSSQGDTPAVQKAPAKRKALAPVQGNARKRATLPRSSKRKAGNPDDDYQG